MPTATAPETKKPAASNSTKNPPVTWAKLPDDIKRQFFQYARSDTALSRLIQTYNVQGVTPEDIRFQQYVETASGQTGTQKKIEDTSQWSGTVPDLLHARHGEQTPVNML